MNNIPEMMHGLPEGINPGDVILTPYEEMTREELIDACKAHDAHHQWHHEQDDARPANVRKVPVLTAEDVEAVSIETGVGPKTIMNVYRAILSRQGTDAQLDELALARDSGMPPS